jgi:predicted Rossmann fold flavoprotein
MRLAVNDGRITGAVSDSGMDIRCNSVILATGGLSYPSTGSTGDGYRMVKELGHSIIQPRASLVPLNTEEKYVSQMQGLTLKNVSVIFRNSTGKIIYSDFGELLFTHYGVSGPVILSGSRHLADYGYAGASISIDMKPALTHEQLDGRIVRDFMKFSRKNFKNSLNELLPQKMIPVIVKLSGIPGDKPVNQVTKTERLSLVSLLKDFRLHVTGPRPIEEAVVTAGGIAVNEVEPATMQSKIVKGLYFAGEILDVDGYTGGFNLTIAFSTGYTAGNSC